MWRISLKEHVDFLSNFKRHLWLYKTIWFDLEHAILILHSFNSFDANQFCLECKPHLLWYNNGARETKSGREVWRVDCVTLNNFFTDPQNTKGDLQNLKVISQFSSLKAIAIVDHRPLWIKLDVYVGRINNFSAHFFRRQDVLHKVRQYAFIKDEDGCLRHYET